MKLFASILLSAAALVVHAECPNHCNGHGTCGEYDSCTCYHGYKGGDCSQRICPHAFAWADAAAGDLNHDGKIEVSAGTTVQVQGSVNSVAEYFPISTDPKMRVAAQEAHLYAECAGRGVCDRSSGVCQCYDGYTGFACQRTTCPNECSGNGVCYTIGSIAELALNKREEYSEGGVVYYEGMQGSSQYRLWDRDHRTACVCDPGFSGHDCSLRQCPRGDDPMTTADYSCGGSACVYDVQKINFNSAQIIADLATGSFVTLSLNYTHWDGEEYESQPFTFSLGDAGDSNAEPIALTHFIEQALLGLPNNAVSDISVSCTASDSSNCKAAAGAGVDVTKSFVVAVTFRTPSGIIQPIELNLVDSTPGSAQQYTTNNYVEVQTKSTADHGTKERIECSNRGLCNYRSGECQCFAGYTGPACSSQNALAVGQGAHRALAAAASAAGSSDAASIAAEGTAGSQQGGGDADAAQLRERRRLQRQRKRQSRRRR